MFARGEFEDYGGRHSVEDLFTWVKLQMEERMIAVSY